MTLIVYPYIQNRENGKIEEIEAKLDSNRNDSFGFEVWRHKIWGSKKLEKLGYELLITLREYDIYAE